MKSLQIITLGCSKNTVDTEHLLSQVKDAWRIVPENEICPVDVLLINTCGFIGDAKEESIQTILSAAERKKSGEVGRLMVFGCLSQRYMSQMPELIPEVDFWFGARDLDPIVKALGCVPAKNPARLRTDHRAYAYLKISEAATEGAPTVPFRSSGERTDPFRWRALWPRPRRWREMESRN